MKIEELDFEKLIKKLTLYNDCGNGYYDFTRLTYLANEDILYDVASILKSIGYNPVFETIDPSHYKRLTFIINGD